MEKFGEQTNCVNWSLMLSFMAVLTNGFGTGFAYKDKR